MRIRRASGQVMVLLAMLIPLVLLPVAAYAAEAGYAASRAAQLEWAATRAAEDATQMIDSSALRSSSTLVIDSGGADARAAAELRALDPRAVIESVQVSGLQVSVAAYEDVPATLAFWLPGGRLRVRAAATARLTPGYSIPSSALPFETRSLAVTASLSSSAPSSSRQREGWMNG